MPYRDPVCAKARHARYYLVHQDMIRAKSRAYRAANRDHVLALQRAAALRYYYRNQRKLQLARYGLTPDGFAELLKQQDGKCAICRRAPATEVDHDHESGSRDTGRRAESARIHVRGLLCKWCNIGLGNFRDDPVRLREAAAYLESR